MSGPAPDIDWAWVARALERWFASNARDLPWRGAGRSGYRALVSEAMLQQTQVSRVVEAFDRFMNRFPDVESLAAADEADVLELWSGLGYYRRARSLHAAAKAVVETHAGTVPSDATKLLALPGVGRYTAGAISSIVFGEPEPLVDGNVVRVLTRLCGDDWAADDPEAVKTTWERAESFADAAGQPGVANEALMELGATICTKRSPACGICPLAARCVANKTDRAEDIPLAKRAVPRTVLWHQLVVVRDDAGGVLMDRRGDDGLWAGLWQPIGLDGGKRATKASLESELGVRLGSRLDRFEHLTTHRRVRGEGYEAALDGDPPGRSGFVEPSAVLARGLSSVHRRVLGLAGVVRDKAESADR